jgi:hypothetical protein
MASGALSVTAGAMIVPRGMTIPAAVRALRSDPVQPVSVSVIPTRQRSIRM